MIVSRMVSHAIGAIVRAGRAPAGTFISATDLIANAELPSSYRHSLLQILATNGLLRSDPKVDAHYALCRPLKSIRLLAVIEMVDGPPVKFAEVPASLKDDIGPVYEATFDVLSQTVRDALDALTMDRFSSPA